MRHRASRYIEIVSVHFGVESEFRSFEIDRLQNAIGIFCEELQWSFRLARSLPCSLAYMIIVEGRKGSRTCLGSQLVTTQCLCTGLAECPVKLWPCTGGCTESWCTSRSFFRDLKFCFGSLTWLPTVQPVTSGSHRGQQSRIWRAKLRTQPMLHFEWGMEIYGNVLQMEGREVWGYINIFLSYSQYSHEPGSFTHTNPSLRKPWRQGSGTCSKIGTCLRTQNSRVGKAEWQGRRDKDIRISGVACY